MHIVLTGGCFDILHAGHIHFLKNVKNKNNYVVVLLESDENIEKKKGKGRPIHNYKERKLHLEALKYVDKVVAVPKTINKNTYLNLIKKIKPDVIAFTDDDPIKEIKKAQAINIGAKNKIVKKYKSHSSTKIIKLFED